MDFVTYLPRSWTSPTSFPFPMSFFPSFARHPWVFHTSSMNTCHLHTLIHENFIRQYPWETLHYVVLLWSIPLETLLLGLFPSSFVWVLSTRIPSLLQLWKGHVSALSMKRNFHNLATLPHTTMGSNINCWGDTPWGDYTWDINITYVDIT